MLKVLGIEPLLLARVADEPVAERAPEPEAEKDAAGWAVAEIPSSESATPAPRQPRKVPEVKVPTEPARYGESVVRELLGASFIEEEQVAPRVVPRPADD